MDDKLFEEVIEKRDYNDFFLGKGKYFILDREYGEHWVYGAFKQVLWPYAQKHGEQKFESEFWNGILNLLKDPGDDINLILDAVVNNILVFYQFPNPSIRTRRIFSTPSGFPSFFKDKFIESRHSLKKDKRSVGADWNSVNKGDGLWGGILYNLKLIEEKGGPKIYSEIMKDI